MRKDKKYKLKISLVTWWYLFFFVIGLLSQSCSVYSLPTSKILIHKRIIRSSECGDGTFRNTEGICEPCQVCDPNSVNNTLCTKISDAICGPCKKGYVKWDSGCLPCENGPGLEKCELTTVTKQVHTSTDLRPTSDSPVHANTSESPSSNIPNFTTRKRTKPSNTGTIDWKLGFLALVVIFIICIIVIIFICCKKNGYFKDKKLSEALVENNTFLNDYKDTAQENIPDLEKRPFMDSQADKNISQARNDEMSSSQICIREIKENTNSFSLDSLVQHSKPIDGLSLTINPTANRHKMTYNSRQKHKQEIREKMYSLACKIGRDMAIQSINYDIREKIQEEIDKIPECWRKFGNNLIEKDGKVTFLISNAEAKQNYSYTEKLLDIAESNGKTVEDVLVALSKLECVQKAMLFLCNHIIKLSELKNDS